MREQFRMVFDTPALLLEGTLGYRKIGDYEEAQPPRNEI